MLVDGMAVMEVLLMIGELEDFMSEEVVEGIEPGASVMGAEAVLENVW